MLRLYIKTYCDECQENCMYEWWGSHWNGYM
jgi:hypothetical protein